MAKRWRAGALALPSVTALVVLVGCSDDGGSEEAFCATARAFAEDNPAQVFDRYDPADPAAAAGLLREAGERLHEWADDAPSEIDDDVEVIANAADDLATAFGDPDPRASSTAELAARFTQVEEASARVTGYARERCGVELDPAGAPVTVTPTAPTAPAGSSPTTAP